MPHYQPVLVPVMYDVVKAGETFDTLADFIDAVKTRAARLRVPYNASLITEALTTMEHTRKLPVRSLRRERPRERVERPRDLEPPVSRETATRVVRELRARVERALKEQ